MLHRPAFVVLTALVLLGASLSTWLAVGTGDAAGAPSAPSPSLGVALNRPLPPDIVGLSLQDQTGDTVTLGQLRGRAVFLVPFLTSCQEECPITTGALLEMARSIAQDGLTHKAVIVEVTVDPDRDVPARPRNHLRYRRPHGSPRTKAGWPRRLQT